MEIPTSYVIQFKDNQSAELRYQGETNGIHKYVAEFEDRNALQFGEKTKLILTIETKFFFTNTTIFKTRDSQ